MSKVKAVPEGYHTITPFLNVKGASDAIAFYKKAFGAEERYRHATPDGSLIHAEIQVGDSIVMLSDAMMNAPTQSSLHLYVNDPDALWRRATEAGAKVVTPLGDMFWGDRYGVVEDRWGNRWAIAAHVEDVSGPELQRRAAEAMKNMKPPA